MTTRLLIRPRLTDYHGITLAYEDADFAISFFDEDILRGDQLDLPMPRLDALKSAVSSGDAANQRVLI